MHDELVISFKRWVLHKMSVPTDRHDRVAIAKADKKLQTVITIHPKLVKTNFYSLLKFTPYQDLFEGGLRIIDLPRKTKLQFDANNSNLLSTVTPFSLADDDGVADFCSDMMRKIQMRDGRKFKEADVQTDLMVKPQVLEDDQIATVFTDVSVQNPAAPAIPSTAHTKPPPSSVRLSISKAPPPPTAGQPPTTTQRPPPPATTQPAGPRPAPNSNKPPTPQATKPPPRPPAPK